MTMLRTLATLAALAILQGTALADSIIFTSGGSIQRVNTDGTGLQVISTPLGSIYGLEVDPVNGKIYWIETDTSSNLASIRRANQDGSGLETVVGNLTPSRSLAIDPVHRQIYYTKTTSTGSTFTGVTSESTLYRVGFDGTGQSAVLQTATALGAIAVDGVNGTIYYADILDSFTSTSDIRAVDLDGSNPRTLLNGLFLGARFLEVDPALGSVYVGSITPKRMNLDGSGIQDLSSLGAALRLAIDPSGWLYASPRSSRGLLRFDLDGSNPGSIPGLDGVSALHIAFLPTVTAVPEPSSLALLGSGVLGLIGYSVRRRLRRA